MEQILSDPVVVVFILQGEVGISTKKKCLVSLLAN